MIEVKRAAELFLVDYLLAALPFFAFYPSRGGGKYADATAPEPPFGVVSIDESDHPLGSDVWMLHGNIVWVTAMEQDVVVGSDQTRQIHEALKVVPSGVDPSNGLIVHGFDVNTTGEFNDSDRQARGDIFSFALGVTQA